MAKLKIQVYIREVDTELSEHFENVLTGDQAAESRRLMKLGLEYEKNKAILQESKENDKSK